jgi:transposase
VTRTEAAKIDGVELQIIRDWVLNFNERDPDGLLNGKSPGHPSKLDNGQRQAFARMIESGRIPAVPGVVRWRLIDLAQWIFEEFRITVAKQTLSRELRAMGYRKLSARPRHHAQVEGVIEDFKLSRVPGYNRAREGDRQRQDRNLVLRRGPYRPKQQDHLRRSCRPLLCGMEQARRSALAHYVHRSAPMGARVLIKGTEYKALLTISL